MQLVIRSNDRRDLNSSQRAAIAVEAEEVVAMLKAEAKAKQAEFHGNQYKSAVVEKIPQVQSNPEQNKVRTQLAETFGTNPRYVSDAARLKEQNPEAFKQVLTGAKTISEVKKEEKVKQIEQRREEIRNSLEEQELKPGEKKYRIVYADPPWKYGNAMPEYVTEPQDYYLLMDTADICNMPVKDIAEPNAVLFMWSTSPHLPEALEVVKAWGFTYKTTFVWDKVKHNMGHYNSVRHEFLLVCTRGACTPDVKKLFDSVVSIERTEHSKKPEFFREIIETIYTHGNKIELFARFAPKGWDVFGNQSN
jgi:N6-adenosine-specific RNA methylase IME4